MFCSTGASTGPECGVFVILLIGCLVFQPSFPSPFPSWIPFNYVNLNFFCPLRGNCLAYSRQCVTTCTLNAKCSKHCTVLSWDLRLWFRRDMFRLLLWYWEATMSGLVEGLLGGGGKSCSVCRYLRLCCLITAERQTKNSVVYLTWRNKQVDA